MGLAAAFETCISACRSSCALRWGHQPCGCLVTPTRVGKAWCPIFCQHCVVRTWNVFKSGGRGVASYCVLVCSSLTKNHPELLFMSFGALFCTSYTRLFWLESAQGCIFSFTIPKLHQLGMKISGRAVSLMDAYRPLSCPYFQGPAQHLHYIRYCMSPRVV